MKAAAFLTISFRYLFARGPGRRLSLKRIRSGIVGIALSLVPLVIVFQVANGMIAGISQRFIETGTFHVQAWPVAAGERAIDPRAVAAVRAVEGVTWAAPELQGMALAATRQRSLGVSVRAVSPDLAAEPGFRATLRVVDGAFALADPQAVVVGQELARNLGLRVGDPLRLVTASGLGGGALLPRVSNFRVAGIVSSGYQILDGKWVFVNIDRGRRIMPGDTASEILTIKVRRPQALPNPLYPEAGAGRDGAALERIEAALGDHWRCYTWYELSRGQFNNFVVTRNILVFIMVLIVLVAAVNVFSSMVMLVVEKQSEIAILKSVGARPAGVGLIFVVAGGITGAIGATVGLGIGALAAWRVNELMSVLEWLINAVGAGLWQLGAGLSGAPYQAVELYNPAFYLDRIPIELRLGDFAWMWALTVALSMAASCFPALRAARLRPLQILRKV